MNFLKGFINFIIGVILFALIFTLIFVRETNKIVSSDVLKDSINNVVKDLSSNDVELSDSEKDIIDDIFKDDESKEIITLILKNYKEYRNSDNYYISDEDYKTVYDYIHKYRNDIKSSKIERMNEEEFKEYFSSTKINDIANDVFENLDEVIDSNVIDKILDGYTLASSYLIRLALIFVILFFIFLLCLVNVSLIKWMVIFGGSLIASGSLFIILYFGAETVKEFLLNDKISININLGSFLFVGIVQIVLGIILKVIYNVLKNRKNDDVAIK